MVFDGLVSNSVHTVHDFVLCDLLVAAEILCVDITSLCDHAPYDTDIIKLRLHDYNKRHLTAP